MKDLESGPDQDRYLLIGKVVKAHGIKGEVKLHPYADDPANIVHYRELMLRGGPAGGGRAYDVHRCRPQGKLAIVALADIVDRDQAEELIGCEVWVDKEQLPELDDDEFYWHEFVGLTVVTEEGRELGSVSSLMSTGAHEVMVVTGRGREYLIPARPEFIVHRDAQRLVIAPPPGLLEINE